MVVCKANKQYDISLADTAASPSRHLAVSLIYHCVVVVLLKTGMVSKIRAQAQYGNNPTRPSKDWVSFCAWWNVPSYLAAQPIRKLDASVVLASTVGVAARALVNNLSRQSHCWTYIRCKQHNTSRQPRLGQSVANELSAIQSNETTNKVKAT